MKRYAFVMAALAILFAGNSNAQGLEFSLKATPDGLSEIGLVYSEYYRVEPSVIVDLERRRLSEDDMSVLLFLSDRARVAPEMILRWRLSGESWWVITERLRLDPIDVFYVPVPEHVQPGPPFGRAYGHFKKRRARAPVAEAFARSHGPLFDDDDIRNLVQLRLVSEYYGHRPEDVMVRRSKGEHFRNMIRAEYERKHGKRALKDALKEDKRERKEDREEKRHKRHEEEHRGKKKHWD